MKFEGWEKIEPGVWMSPVEEHTFTEQQMKEIVMKFDHDNEGKEALSPHAAMARKELDDSLREADEDLKAGRTVSLDEALAGFWKENSELEVKPLKKSFIAWYCANIFDDAEEAREEWEDILATYDPGT